jgi:hypothetical protein
MELIIVPVAKCLVGIGWARDGYAGTVDDAEIEWAKNGLDVAGQPLYHDGKKRAKYVGA